MPADIELSNASNVLIEGNISEGALTGFLREVGAGSQRITIRDNDITTFADQGDSSIDVPASHSIVQGNRIAGQAAGPYILASGVTHAIITGNELEDVLGHGIEIVDSSDMIVSDNLIHHPGASATNTYDGIILSGNSDRNKITDNKVIPRATGNTTRYGVNVSAATCDTNVVADNMLVPAASFGTGAYNDAGTGTITARDGNGQFT